jgi:hypothetical protein
MFIIERRTAGVLAALATTAAMVVLGNVWEPVDEIETPHIATSTPALAGSVGPGVRDNCFPGDRAGAEASVVRGDATPGRCGDLNVR